MTDLRESDRIGVIDLLKEFLESVRVDVGEVGESERIVFGVCDLSTRYKGSMKEGNSGQGVLRVL